MDQQLEVIQSTGRNNYVFQNSLYSEYPNDWFT